MGTDPSCFIIADDLGYTRNRSAGILELARLGRLSAASLMVNGRASAWAAKKAGECGLPLALHFNCTEGYPLSTSFASLKYLALQPESSIPLEPQEKENSLPGFPGKERSWERLHQGSRELVKAVLDEITAQVEAFYQLTGYYPKTINGHQHIHLHPSLAQPLALHLKALGVREVRCPDETLPEASPAFLKYVAYCAKQAQIHFEAAGLYVRPHFFGLAGSHSQLRLSAIRTALTRVRRGSLELMVHPGYCDEDLDEYSALSHREEELSLLASDTFLAFLEEFPLEQ